MSHSYTNNHVHVIYSTYNRQDLIPPAFEKRLYSFIAEIGREHKIPLLAAGGMPNHSHLLFLLPATMTLAKAVTTFKANSSRFLRKQRIPFNWQEGYGAFAVSASQIDTVIAYIRNQRERHRKRSFEQEFLAMLKKARVPFDPKYVFGWVPHLRRSISKSTRYPALPGLGSRLASRPSGPGIFAPIESRHFHAHARVLARDPSTRQKRIAAHKH